MAKKETKEQLGVVTVTYHITDELVDTKFGFIRWDSRLNASDGISAVYIDDKKKNPTKTISFSEPGEHKVRIVLEDSVIIPLDFFRHSKNIYSVDIPDTVTTIEADAFRFTRMTCPPVLPSNLKSIGGSAFDGAFVNVDTLQLPDSVEIVGEDAFKGVKHLIVGKNYRGLAKFLNDYEKVTIPDDNHYLEVRDGFIVNRETKEVQGMLPDVFTDAEDVTIRLPEGTTAFHDELFNRFIKASIYIPGSVEKCCISSSSWGEPVKRSIELAEGIKEIELSADTGVEFNIPLSTTKLNLHGLKCDHMSIPAGCLLEGLSCSIAQLELGPNVSIKSGSQVFEGFEGEVFVKGPIHFEDWGRMEDKSVIHVPDEETGRKILNSLNFNKKVRIFIGDKLLSDQEEGSQEKRLFRLLGCPNYSKTLKAIEPDYYGRMPKAITLLYNVPDKTTAQIAAKGLVFELQYSLDDGVAKKFRRDSTLSGL